MSITNNELKKEIESIVRKVGLTESRERWNDEAIKEPTEALLNLFTEMVEGELRGFVEWVDKKYEGLGMVDNNRKELEQYLLERKKQ